LSHGGAKARPASDGLRRGVSQQPKARQPPFDLQRFDRASAGIVQAEVGAAANRCSQSAAAGSGGKHGSQPSSPV
jgi:hypothetical protein